MNKKFLLSKLGLASGTRAVVLHADDIGLCHATVAAYQDIAARGILSSASAMAPCSWFPSVAACCAANPEAHDMGVHLTLNSEWDNYRFAPLTGIKANGLTDKSGYFHKRAIETHRFLDIAEAYEELRAQVKHAQSMGIDVTHIDSHMLTLINPALLDIYLRISREFGIPNSIVRMSADEIHARTRIPMEQAQSVAEKIAAADAEGLIVFDAWTALPLNQTGNRLDCAKRILESIPAGLTICVSHPAIDTPELRAIASDWEARVADYHLYLDDEWEKALDASDVKVLNMREIREVLF